MNETAAPGPPDHVAPREAAVVIAIDTSWPYRDAANFAAVRRAALALSALARERHPSDVVQLVSFSAYARQIEMDDLPELSADESVLGTNWHHAFLVARDLLERFPGMPHAILLLSSGEEPTAHLDRGRCYFAYPPAQRTIDETLDVIRSCSEVGIAIRIVYPRSAHYLSRFVEIASQPPGVEAVGDDDAGLVHAAEAAYLEWRSSIGDEQLHRSDLLP